MMRLWSALGPAKVSGPLARTEYRCDGCGQIYTRVLSHEEALEQEREEFGFNTEEVDRAIVCEDCFQAVTASYSRRSGGDA